MYKDLGYRDRDRGTASERMRGRGTDQNTRYRSGRWVWGDGYGEMGRWVWTDATARARKRDRYGNGDGYGTGIGIGLGLGIGISIRIGKRIGIGKYCDVYRLIVHFDAIRDKYRTIRDSQRRQEDPLEPLFSILEHKDRHHQTNSQANKQTNMQQTASNKEPLEPKSRKPCRDRCPAAAFRMRPCVYIYILSRYRTHAIPFIPFSLPMGVCRMYSVLGDLLTDPATSANGASSARCKAANRERCPAAAFRMQYI